MTCYTASYGRRIFLIVQIYYTLYEEDLSVKFRSSCDFGLFSLSHDAFFIRLCAIAINPNSVVTFSLPLSVNLRKLLFCFMFPKTSSTSAALSFRCTIPSSLVYCSLSVCLCLCRLWFTSMIRLPWALWHTPLNGHP